MIHCSYSVGTVMVRCCKNLNPGFSIWPKGFTVYLCSIYVSRVSSKESRRTFLVPGEYNLRLYNGSMTWTRKVDLARGTRFLDLKSVP